MEFPDLSMGQYITNQYTQNVANALSSVTNVPSTAISTLDVRPFIAGSKAGRRRSRTLLQSSGNGVQATYFLATNDPQAISDKLSAAGEDGSLSTKLSQYGITAQAGGLKVQSFLPAPPTSGSSSGSSGFPMWAVGVIVAAIVLLALAVLLWFCCFRRKKNRQAKEYAPETKLTSGGCQTIQATTSGRVRLWPGRWLYCKVGLVKHKAVLYLVATSTNSTSTLELHRPHSSLSTWLGSFSRQPAWGGTP